MRKENIPLKAQAKSTCTSVNEARRPRFTEQEKLARGLFANNLLPKPTVEHPFNKDSNRKLMEGVHDSSIDDKTFNFAHDHLVLIRLPAIIRQVKGKYKVEAGKPFKILDP